MPIWGDYHTHTTYSHGKGTVMDNVEAAAAAGLKAVAITDHGFRHMLYNMKHSEIQKLREEIEVAKIRYPDMQIYLGVESNINGLGGSIDVREQDIAKIDLLVCGYHRMVFSPSLGGIFNFWLPNVMDGSASGRRRRKKNTDAFIKALTRFPIDILSHPKYKIDIDVVEVARAAAHFGTYMELNGKKVSMSDEEIERILTETNANFIIDSDAHHPSRVGEVSVPTAVVERLHIPTERLANMDKLPVLRLQRERGLLAGADQLTKDIFERTK